MVRPLVIICCMFPHFMPSPFAFPSVVSLCLLIWCDLVCVCVGGECPLRLKIINLIFWSREYLLRLLYVKSIDWSISITLGWNIIWSCFCILFWSTIFITIIYILRDNNFLPHWLNQSFSIMQYNVVQKMIILHDHETFVQFSFSYNILYYIQYT